jgi:hypothetical protein
LRHCSRFTQRSIRNDLQGSILCGMLYVTCCVAYADDLPSLSGLAIQSFTDSVKLCRTVDA